MTMNTDLADRLAGLSVAERRRLLARLKARKEGITARHAATAPLSTAQQRLWFLDRLDPGNPAYTMAFAVRIRGELDHRGLARALDAVLTRHQVLRSVFVDVDGAPSQIVRESVDAWLPYVDISANPEELAALTATHARTRFDLPAGPPIAVRLVRLAEDEHLLLVAVHHIAFDGRSTDLFMRELVAHYGGTHTPELPAQFGDWAAWEAEHLATGSESRLTYWRERLADSPARSTLTPDFPRPDVQAHRSGSVPFDVPADVVDALVALARETGVTLNAVVLAGFAALVGRHAGQDEILLGMPTAGRSRAELEPLIGSFADTLVLRVDLAGNPTLRELVRRVHDELRRAMSNQDVPYTRVVEAVAPTRTPRHNPLFQIMVSVTESGQEHRLSVGDTTFAAESLGDRASDFDLFLALSRQGNRFGGLVGYDADLFLTDTVDDLLAGFTHVLREMTAAPDIPLREADSLRRRGIPVVATFTADPVSDSLGYWLRLLRLPVAPVIAPYGQVVQQLAGATPSGQPHVVLLRWEDALRHRDDLAGTEQVEVLERSLDDMLGALRLFRDRSDDPVVVGVTPPSGRFGGHPWDGVFARLEDRLMARCRPLEGVSVIPATEWSRRYPTASVTDSEADALGHVPYTPEFFAAMGTRLARELYGLLASPFGTVAFDPAPWAGNGAVDRFVARQVRHGRRVVPDPEAGALVLSPTPIDVPGATVVTVPAEPADLLRFLDHLWPLDRPVPRPGTVGVAGERIARIAALTDPADIAELSRPVARLSAPADEPVVPPRTPTERRLRVLWHDVIRPDGTAPDDVGVTTSFFALGGHSLLAMRLLSTVHAEFGRHVPLAAFLAGPTIEQLAELVEQADGDRIERVDRAGELTPSSTQQRLWTLAQLGGDATRHNITASLTLRGPLDRTALRLAVDEIVARHEVLRTTFAERDGRPVAVIGASMSCWLPDVAGGEDRLHEHAETTYDLERGPLLLARLVRVSEMEHQLLLGMHHIVSDAWSWGVFLRELATLYSAFRAGEPSPLPPLPIQFADYAAWQERQPTAGHEEFWREHMAGAPERMNLATERPRPATRTNGAARARRVFAPGLGPALRALSGAEDASLFSALLTGLALVLRRHSGDEDLVVGTPVSGRDRPELEPLIGCFTDILPLRLAMDGHSSFRDLIRRVQSGVVAAYQHQRLPFARIVETVADRRDPRHHPVFQVMFNFLDQPEIAPELSGLDVTVDELPATGTDFDLFLTMSWEGDRLSAGLTYSTDLFGAPAAERLLASLEGVLAELVARPEGPVSAVRALAPVDMPEHWTPRAAPAEGPVVVVVSSFTADPMRAAAEHWLRVAGIPAVLEFAPYGQVFQQLLDPGSALGDSPVGLVLLRWDDWLRHEEPAARPPAAAVARLEERLLELCSALRTFRESSGSPLVVAICPPSTGFTSPAWTRLFGGLDERVRRFATGLAAVTVESVAHLARPYRVREVHDDAADQLGHMPYTPEFYAALGTVAARVLRRAFVEPVRTIVVDPRRWQPELLRLLRPALRDGVRLALCSPGEITGLDRLPIHPAEIAEVRSAQSVLDHVTGLAGSGLLVLDPDPAYRERFPQTPCVPLPSDTAALRESLAHVWYLDPPIGSPSLRGAVADALQTPVTARDILGLIEPARRRDGDAAYRAPRTDLERRLTAVWVELLRVDRVGIDDDFGALGGDSMLAIRAVSMARRTGIALTPRQVLEHRTIAELAAAAGARPAVARPGPDDGPTPLTPGQRWFLDTVAPRIPNPAHFNHPYYLELREPADPDVLRQALQHLAAHHDSLRLRFSPGETGEWSQQHAASPRPAFDSHDVSDEDELVEICARAQSSLDLTNGPVVRVVHLRPAEGRERLLIVPHHLVVDAISRGVLLEDLQTLYRQIAAGAEPTLPPKTTSVQEWARRLEVFAASDEVHAELPFWLAQAAVPDARLPVDFPAGRPTCGSFDSLRRRLSEAETEALRAAARRAGMKLGDLFVGVAARWLADKTGMRDCAVAVAGHGRENLFADVDLSRTVGWFQVYYPLRVEAAGLGAVRKQLARVPRNGIGHALLRYASPDRAVRDALAAVEAPQVSVNFMGDFGFGGTPNETDLFDVFRGPYGPPQDETGEWLYLLDVVPSIVRNELVMQINYSDNVHERETAERMLDELLDLVHAVIAGSDLADGTV